MVAPHHACNCASIQISTGPCERVLERSTAQSVRSHAEHCASTWTAPPDKPPAIGPALSYASSALEHVHVLVLLVASRRELEDAPARAELCEHPLGAEEGGAPVWVHDAPVAMLAELGGVPRAVAVEGFADLKGLL